MNNTYVSDSKSVLVPGNGHNFHLFDDCYGIKLGQGFHATYGDGIYSAERMTVADAVGNAKFACRVCYKRAGLAIPAEADRVAIRNAARAERLAAKAAKAETVEVVEAAAVEAPADVEVETVTVETVNKMIMQIMSYLAELTALKATLIAA